MTTVAEAPVDLSTTASQVASLLDQIQALIPGFTPPEPSRRKHVAANARFASDVIPAAIAATENYEPLRQTNILDVEAARNALAIRDAFRPLFVRMQAISDGGNFTIDQRMANSGVQVLQLYDWVKRHLRLPEAAGLRPYAEQIAARIEKALNRRRPKPAETPQTPPAQTFMASRPQPIPDDVNEIAELIGEAGDDE